MEQIRPTQETTAKEASWWQARTRRAAGRHRAGEMTPTAPPQRREWDTEARDMAARLDRAYPSWTILYGTHSRLFYAMAAWAADEPVIVTGRTPAELAERIRDTASTARLAGLVRTWAGLAAA